MKTHQYNILVHPALSKKAWMRNLNGLWPLNYLSLGMNEKWQNGEKHLTENQISGWFGQLKVFTFHPHTEKGQPPGEDDAREVLPCPALFYSVVCFWLSCTYRYDSIDDLSAEKSTRLRTIYSTSQLWELWALTLISRAKHSSPRLTWPQIAFWTLN